MTPMIAHILADLILLTVIVALPVAVLIYPWLT